MTDPLVQIRSKWFEGTPKEKIGVTERYVVFGEARRWMIDRLRLNNYKTILDMGSGHGFLSFELASKTKALVLGLDFLTGKQLKIAIRGAKTGGLQNRISWVVGDARTMPFPPDELDCILSFLSLQDVYMTGGKTALSRILEDCARVVRLHGLVTLADNFFPECTKSPSQKLYSRIHKEEFGAVLPSKDLIISKMQTCGLDIVEEAYYDPQIRLDKEESKVELRDIVDARPFGKVFDFERIWTKYGNKIGDTGLAYPRVLLIVTRKMRQSF